MLSRPGRLLEHLFRVCGRNPSRSSARQPCEPSEAFFYQVAIFTTFRRLLLRGSARRCLLASSLCCHTSFISTFTPGPAHQPCVPRGCLECGASSAAVEMITLTRSTIGGERGCNNFVPVLRGNGTKIARNGDTFDQPPGQIR